MQWTRGVEEPLEEKEEDKKLEPLEEFLGIKEEMEKLANLLDQARENAMDSGEKDEQEKKRRLLKKMTKEQPKEGIDMDTDKDLSDAHEEKAKEASENLQKREADDKFRSAGTDDNGENNENFRFNRKKRTMANEDEKFRVDGSESDDENN